VLEQGLNPVLSVTESAAGPVEVVLRLQSPSATAPVGSGQGELRFDPARLTLVGASLPDGVAGAWNEVEPGRVRFASVSPAGLPDGSLLVLRFAARERLRAEWFAVQVEEVTAAAGFTNLTSIVVPRDHPHLVFQ
jgi:hypothetical protein